MIRTISPMDFLRNEIQREWAEWSMQTDLPIGYSKSSNSTEIFSLYFIEKAIVYIHLKS